MLANFRTYQFAIQFHAQCRVVALPAYLKNQLLRASSSVALNLAEGSARPTLRDRLRFYNTARASFIECQAAWQLSGVAMPADVLACMQCLGGSLYRLCNQGRVAVVSGR